MQDKLLLWKPNVSTNVLNAFDVPTKRWSSLGIDGDVDGLVGPALSSISAPDRRTSFALSPDLPGFVMLNASDPDHLTWTNTTTQGPRGIAVPAVWGDSEMVYVPLGQKGVLLVFGAYYLVRREFLSKAEGSDYFLSHPIMLKGRWTTSLSMTYSLPAGTRSPRLPQIPMMDCQAHVELFAR